MRFADFLDSLPKGRDFAAEIGVSRQALHRYREGQRTPRPEIMVRIREASNGKVTANDFLPPRVSRAASSKEAAA